MYLEKVCLLKAYFVFASCSKDLLSESSDVSIDEINSEYEEDNSNEICNGRSNRKTKK